MSNSDNALRTLKEEVKWLADVEQTARAVLRQNRVLPTKPVELTAEEVLRLVAGYRRAHETRALQPGEDIAEALERRGDALSVRAARHIRIKWNTEEGLRQQLRRTNDQLNGYSAQKAPADLCQPHGKDWLTCLECAREAVKAEKCEHGIPRRFCTALHAEIGNEVSK
jgi:hypothetical protein